MFQLYTIKGSEITSFMFFCFVIYDKEKHQIHLEPVGLSKRFSCTIPYIRPTAHTHSLAILSLHVHEVGGVEAAVHAFLVPGDSTFNRDATRSRTKDKLFKICNID